MHSAWSSYDRAVRDRVMSEFTEKTSQPLTSYPISFPPIAAQHCRPSTASFVSCAFPCSVCRNQSVSDPLLPLRNLLPASRSRSRPSSPSRNPSSASGAPPASLPPPPLSFSSGTAASALHSQYRRALSALFLDIKTEEERRIEQSKAFLLQTLISLNATLETLHEKVRAGIVAVTSVDAADDLHHFIDLGHLHLTDDEAAGHTTADATSHAPVTVFDLTPPTRDSALLHRMYALEVEREGSLAQGPGGSSRSSSRSTGWPSAARASCTAGRSAPTPRLCSA